MNYLKYFFQDSGTSWGIPPRNYSGFLRELLRGFIRELLWEFLPVMSEFHSGIPSELFQQFYARCRSGITVGILSKICLDNSSGNPLKASSGIPSRTSFDIPPGSPSVFLSGTPSRTISKMPSETAYGIPPRIYLRFFQDLLQGPFRELLWGFLPENSEFHSGISSRLLHARCCSEIIFDFFFLRFI